jgi:hypothetical protein
VTLREWYLNNKGGLQLLADALDCEKQNIVHIANGRKKLRIEEVEVICDVTGLTVQEVAPHMVRLINKLHGE